MAFEARDPRSTVETAPVEVARNRTANGGWEYWLVLDGERVGGEFGLFTDRAAKPANVLPRLLARLVGTEGL